MTITLNGTDISQLVLSAQIEKSILSPVTRARLELAASETDYFLPSISPVCGDRVTILGQGISYTGIVERASRLYSRQRLELLCFDSAAALCRNELYGAFSGSSGSIARTVAAKCGISAGNIFDGARTFVPPACGMSGFDIISAAYGKSISAYIQSNRLNIEPIGSRRYSLTEGPALELSTAHSLERMVNRCQIIGYGGRIAASASLPGALKYGERGIYRGLNGGAELAHEQAVTRLNGAVRTASLTTALDTAIMCGGFLQMGGAWGIVGDFAITYICHSLGEGGTTKIDLECEK